MTFLEYELASAQQYLRLLRHLYVGGDPLVTTKQILNAHYMVERAHRAITRAA